MSVVKSFRKASVERRRLYIDYSCFLEETEALSNLQIVISPLTLDAPLAVNSGFTDAAQKKVVMYVSGGVPNTDYVLSLIAQTNEGQTKKDDLGLRVTR